MKSQFQDTFSRQSRTDYWDSIYDQQNFYADCLRLRMTQALAWLDDSHLDRGAKVLDAGCGAGRQLCEAEKIGFAAFGLDFSHSMLINARSVLKRNNQIDENLCQGDLESLPFHDASFDAILCLGVLTYLSSETKALHELARVLRPGGILIVSIINKARLVRFFDLPLLIKEVFIKVLDKTTASWIKSGDFYHNSRLKSYSIPGMRHSLEDAGFDVDAYETVPLELPTLFGRRVFAQKTSRKIAFLFEGHMKIPIVRSVGGMCVFRAVKKAI